MHVLQLPLQDVHPKIPPRSYLPSAQSQEVPVQYEELCIWHTEVEGKLGVENKRVSCLNPIEKAELDLETSLKLRVEELCENFPSTLDPAKSFVLPPQRSAGGLKLL